MADVNAKKHYYLTRVHFMKMLFAALAVHVASVAVMALMPGMTVNQIPVRVLNIKLGAGGMGGGDGAVDMGDGGDGKTIISAQPRAVPPPAKNQRSLAMNDSATTQRTIPASDAPEPMKRAAEAPVAETQGQSRAGNASRQRAGEQSGSRAGQPSQYVRQAGAGAGAGGYGQGSGNGGSGLGSADAMEITRRYGQVISLWMQKHKSYPADLKRRGVEGSAMIRIRLNRVGQILHFRLEKSTGSPELDEAVLAMVRASNPLPPAPENYPSPNLIEFLIPVNYKLR